MSRPQKKCSQEVVEYKGYLVRPDTLDEYIVNELGGYKVLPLDKKDTVLDIGGCIGTYAKYAAEQGVKKVVTVEPMPDNFEVLTFNVPDRVLAIEAAAVGSSCMTSILNFYVNTGKNKGAHSTIPTRGREVITVKAVQFDTLLRTHKPTKIKMDCEGAEYELLEKPLPKYVKGLVMEMHLTKRGHRKSAADLHKFLLEQGFTTLHNPIFHTKAWNTFACYIRD